MKLKLLMNDIEKNEFFGPTLAGIFLIPYHSILNITLLLHSTDEMHFPLNSDAPNFCYPFISTVVYTIEFQKRGLPHVHLILWLRKDSPLEAAQIDAFISA